jgi:hypothetical protein
VVVLRFVSSAPKCVMILLRFTASLKRMPCYEPAFSAKCYAPLRGWLIFPLFIFSLRCGLHSYAASRLKVAFSLHFSRHHRATKQAVRRTAGFSTCRRLRSGCGRNDRVFSCATAYCTIWKLWLLVNVPVAVVTTTGPVVAAAGTTAVI